MKKVKKRKLCLIIVASILIGIITSVGISCALAETLINSKDVIYEDNSNLVADNVQEAIDGTCSKIDTRLSTIEDKLYNLQKLSGTKIFSPSTEWSYTGLEVTFPAKSYCSISIKPSSFYTPPEGIQICLNSNTNNCVSISSNSEAWSKSTTFSDYSESSTTYYVLTKYARNGVNNESVQYWGFCATKYK